MHPKVFVSSTFFDLAQVRDDLRMFIDQLGYEPLLSEHHSFPVDPTIDTIENCRRRVERDADILVLIVGLRYGSRDPASSHSVTNIEYLAARAKRIPIYVLIQRRLEPLLLLWKAQPDVNLSTQIDTPDLLRFVDQVQSTDRVWTSSFERASEIADYLRTQFAHLMSDGLQWRRQIDAHPSDSYLRHLSGQSLRLALEKPTGWEFLLLAQVLRDEVAAARHLREEHTERLALQLGEDVSDPINWGRRRLNEMTRIAGSLHPIMKHIAARAIGPDGQPGNAADIAFVGRSISRIYVAALEWSRRVRTSNLHPMFANMQEILARFTDAVVLSIEEYPDRLSGFEMRSPHLRLEAVGRRKSQSPWSLICHRHS